MSNEYIRMIEDLKKEYRDAWNIAYKIDKTYYSESVSGSWDDKQDSMEKLENKKENQIVKLKEDIKKETDLIDKLKNTKKKMKEQSKDLQNINSSIKEQNKKLSDLRRTVNNYRF